MQFIRRQMPVVIAFVVGVGLWAQYYIPSRSSQQVLETFTGSWAIILAGAALILGILSAIHHHWTKVTLRKPGFGYSLVTLVCFAIVMFSGWLPVRVPGFAEPSIRDESFFDWVYQNIFVALDATMFSLLAFFIASAAFRAFRARSFEATALLIAGCIMMIGRVPLGEMIAIPNTDISVASVASWILNNPNSAAQRGILLGVLLSMVAISLRIIFGIERTYMGGGD
jgi:uncharacterized membrane-anchored protein